MKNIFIIVILLITKTTNCQNLLVQYDIKNQDKIHTAELIFNDSVSFFNIMSISGIENDNAFFIKNKIENSIFFNEQILNQKIYVKDSINVMKWELRNDTSFILSEKCLSAKTTFRGRSYIAYYSPKYKTDEGPWKFGGLPGLILSIKSEDDFIEWKAKKIIENYSTNMKSLNLSSYKFINWNEFVEQYKQAINKFVKASRSSGKVDDEMSAKIKIEAVEIFFPELQTGEGLTF